MEAKQGGIDQTLADINAVQIQLEKYREELAWHVKNSYKSGSMSVLDVVFGSSDWEGLFCNVC